MIEIYSDIHRSLTVEGGDLKKVLNIDAIVQSVLNVLMTQKGERVMLPEFGTNLPSKIFENFREQDFLYLMNQLKREIMMWEDRIADVIINGTFDQSANRLVLNIGITLKNRPTEVYSSTVIVNL